MLEDKDFVSIISAFYKSLDFFPDKDPLKKKAKEKSLAIMDNLTVISKSNSGGWILLKTYLSDENKRIISLLSDDLDILENYFKIGKNQGWVDGMNFLIILKEISRIKEQVEELKKIIKVDFLNKQEVRLSENLNSVSENKKVNLPLQSGNVDKKIRSSQEKNGVNLADITSRQDKILKILKNKEKTQVGDIIKKLDGVTKRTIRRDLDDLLKKKIIVRHGEWNQVFYKII